MKKNNNKKQKNGQSRSSKVKADVVETGEGKFNFPNGDSYEGNYIVVNNKNIYRQGNGIYKTSDGDEYRTEWKKDYTGSELHILYGNGAKYIGEVDNEGAMHGKGIYIFPDHGGTLSAIWANDAPASEFVYTDPLGFTWLGSLSENEQEVIFSPEHCLW